MSSDTAHRSCRGVTRAGQPCRAAPLRDGAYCSAHDPLRPAGTRFGSHEWASTYGPRGGRPPVPRTTEVMRKVVTENALALLRPYFATLGYELEIGEDGPHLVYIDGGGAKLHATFEGEVVVSEHPDQGAMMAAAEKLLDRVYGKPRQALEVTGEDGGPVVISDEHVDLRQLSDDELAKLQDLVTKAQR